MNRDVTRCDAMRCDAMLGMPMACIRVRPTVCNKYIKVVSWTDCLDLNNCCDLRRAASLHSTRAIVPSYIEARAAPRALSGCGMRLVSRLMGSQWCMHILILLVWLTAASMVFYSRQRGAGGQNRTITNALQVHPALRPPLPESNV